MLKSQGTSLEKIAKAVGSSKSTVRRYLKSEVKSAVTNDVEPESSQKTDGNYFKESPDGSAVLSSITTKPIKTLEDAVRACNVDTTVWYVHSYDWGAWNVGMKKKNGKEAPEEIIQTQQYRIKLVLKRILSRTIQQAHDKLFDRYKSHKIDYSKLPAIKNKNGEKYACVVGLFDSHFGKLCWGEETGKNYDLKIAERIYANAIGDIIDESSHRNVSQWVLPIGNDFFHMDNSRNTTYAGTPQDVDGRYAQVIETGEMAVIRGIEKLIATAPVNVIWVPGNHDPTTSFHLARTVHAWFHSTNRVKVDSSPSPRKYLRLGTTLIGLTHGNEEKREQLPLLMSTERKHDWANTTCREWLTGHLHSRKQLISKPVDSFNGVTVRTLPSITGTDSWHHRKGYTGSDQAVEAYFYGMNRRGYAGHTVVPARTK